MKKWLLCVGVVLAFLFAVVPFLSAEIAISPVAPSKEVVKPKAETPKPAPIPKLTDEQKAKAEKLIKDLGSDDFATREAAEEALKKMGVAVLPLVNKSATSSDVEIVERASRIAEYLHDQLPAGPSKVKITLSLDKRKYKIGETIKVAVHLVNQAKKVVLLPMIQNQYPWQLGLNYVLTGPDGKTIAAEKFKGMIAQPMIKRPPLLMKPSMQGNQTAFMSLVEKLPKENLRLRRIPPPEIRERAKAEKAKAQAVPVERDAAAAKPRVKPIGFLRDGSGTCHFALAKPGKYTLKFRFVAKGDKVQIQERLGVPRKARPAGGMGVQVLVFRPGKDNPVGAADAKPIKGLMESNTVTFEVVK